MTKKKLSSWAEKKISESLVGERRRRRWVEAKRTPKAPTNTTTTAALFSSLCSHQVFLLYSLVSIQSSRVYFFVFRIGDRYSFSLKPFLDFELEEIRNSSPFVRNLHLCMRIYVFCRLGIYLLFNFLSFCVFSLSSLGCLLILLHLRFVLQFTLIFLCIWSFYVSVVSFWLLLGCLIQLQWVVPSWLFNSWRFNILLLKIFNPVNHV